MTDFMKQDVFFFVTTLAVVFVTVLLAILIIYLIKISRKVNYIAGKAKEETDLISLSLAELRQDLKSSRARFKSWLKFISSLFGTKKK